MKNRNITLADSNAPVPPTPFGHYMDANENMNIITRPAAATYEPNGINLNFTKLIPNQHR